MLPLALAESKSPPHRDEPRSFNGLPQPAKPSVDTPSHIMHQSVNHVGHLPCARRHLQRVRTTADLCSGEARRRQHGEDGQLGVPLQLGVRPGVQGAHAGVDVHPAALPTPTLAQDFSRVSL